MRTITETLAANQTKLFEVAGNYFEILTCANDLTRIDWVGEDGQQLDPWQLVKEGVFAAEPFRAFSVTNGPTAQKIKVMVGRGTGGNRAAPVSGEVAITETPGESLARAGQSFVGCQVENQAAANYIGVNLWMPPAETKRAELSSITLSSSVDVGVVFEVGTYAAAWAVGDSGFSKLDQVARSRVNMVALSYGSNAPAAPDFMYVALKAGQAHRVQFDGPVILGAGRRLSMKLDKVGPVVFGVSCEWAEL